MNPTDIKNDYSIHKYFLNFKDQQVENNYYAAMKNNIVFRYKYALYISSILYLILSIILFNWKSEDTDTMIVGLLCISFSILSFLIAISFSFLTNFNKIQLLVSKLYL